MKFSEIWLQIFSQFQSIFCLSLFVLVKILVVGIWNWSYIFAFPFSFQYRHMGVEIMNIVIMWYPGINERLPWEIHIKGKKLDLLMWENLGKSSFRTHSRPKGIWIKSQKKSTEDYQHNIHTLHYNPNYNLLLIWKPRILGLPFFQISTESLLIWKKKWAKSVQLVRVSFFRSDFLQNPYFNWSTI